MNVARWRATIGLVSTECAIEFWTGSEFIDVGQWVTAFYINVRANEITELEFIFLNIHDPNCPFSITDLPVSGYHRLLYGDEVLDARVIGEFDSVVGKTVQVATEIDDVLVNVV